MTRRGDSEREAARRRRVEELSQRIREIEADDERAYGAFGAIDWIACVLLSVVFPIAIVWWFA